MEGTTASSADACPAAGSGGHFLGFPKSHTAILRFCLCFPTPWPQLLLSAGAQAK